MVCNDGGGGDRQRKANVEALVGKERKPEQKKYYSAMHMHL